MKSNLLFRGQDNAVGYVWLEFAPPRHRRGRHRRHRPARPAAPRHPGPLALRRRRPGRRGLLAAHRRRPADDQEAAGRGDRRARACTPPRPTTGPRSTSACSASAAERYEQLLTLILTLRRPQLAKNLDPVEAVGHAHRRPAPGRRRPDRRGGPLLRRHGGGRHARWRAWSPPTRPPARSSPATPPTCAPTPGPPPTRSPARREASARRSAEAVAAVQRNRAGRRGRAGGRPRPAAEEAEDAPSPRLRARHRPAQGQPRLPGGRADSPTWNASSAPACRPPPRRRRAGRRRRPPPPAPAPTPSTPRRSPWPTCRGRLADRRRARRSRRRGRASPGRPPTPRRPGSPSGPAPGSPSGWRASARSAPPGAGTARPSTPATWPGSPSTGRWRR